MKQEEIQIKNDEITLRDLILKINEYFREVKKSWWIVAIICLMSASISFYLHTRHIPSYKAELRFVVEGQSGSSGLSSLLGSFGIKKGGKVNPFKIIEVGKSTDLLLEVLSSSNGMDDNIANSLISEYKLGEEWSKPEENYKDFRFGKTISNQGTQIERNVIKRLRTIIWEKKNKAPLTNFSLDEETGLYTISTETKSEYISLLITKTLYEKIKLFFEEEVFLNQKQLADILTIKADSIKSLNESKIRQLAQFEDKNRGVFSSQSMVTKQILSQESIALSSAYAEILKNKEMTDVNLKDMQPLFMAIDTPFSPIEPTKSSALLSFLKGLVIGGFIGIQIILLRKIYLDAVRESVVHN